MQALGNGLRLHDQRLVIASVGAFRMFRNPARLYVVAAGVRTKIAENDTPFPLAVLVQSNNFVPSVFAPKVDSVLGANAVFRPIPANVGAGSASFVVPPYDELWVTPTLPDAFRVTESRT